MSLIDWHWLRKTWLLKSIRCPVYENPSVVNVFNNKFKFKNWKIFIFNYCFKLPLSFKWINHWNRRFELLSKGLFTLERGWDNTRDRTISEIRRILTFLHKFVSTLMWDRDVFHSVPARISFIIFWDFLMFCQIFLSPQVKRCAIITYKYGMYQTPHNFRTN